jgi:hypothetical protein
MLTVMKRENLRTGMKVVCKNGVELIVLLDVDESYLVERKSDDKDTTCCIKLRNYNDKLEYTANRNYDIDKVYRLNYFKNIFEDKEENWELIWTRSTVVDWDTARDSDREIKPLENFTCVETLDNFQELDEVGRDMACLSMEEIIKLIEGQWLVKGVD